MARKIILFLSILFSTFGVCDAQLIEPEVSLGLSRDSIMIGDTLRFSVKIKKDMAEVVSIPTFSSSKLTEHVEIVGGPFIDTLPLDGRVQNVEIGYLITSFEAGGHKFDSFPIVIGAKEPYDTLYTTGEEILLVGTYEIDTTKDVPYDIAPIVDVPYSWDEFIFDLKNNWYWIVGALAVLGGIGYGVWWYVRRRRRVALIESLLPPHLRAIGALEKIRNQKLWQSGRYKEYYSDITDTLRIYMEQQYGFGAMEMTSSEILGELRSVHHEERLLSAMRDLFEISDLVKFAKAVPSAEECETAYFDAFYYIEQTKPKEIIENEQVR